MKQGFFETLGIASIERIHSQMLSWLVMSDALTAKQKSGLLNKIFDTTGDHESFWSFTEYRRIDVLIKADNEIFIIENKIKTSEHSNQLKEYIRIVDDPKNFIFGPIINKHFLYLSLIPERNKKSPWITKTYQDLLNILTDFKFYAPQSSEQYIINEYIRSVEHLVESFTNFDQDHTKFINVFTEGHKTKEWKLLNFKKYTTQQWYVAQNNLETIFQKYFLQKINKALKIDEKLISDNYGISEAHGVAILQIDIKKAIYTGKKFMWGIQFQGNSAKINLASTNYHHSTTVDIPKSVKLKLKEFATKNKFRFNPGYSKAYISISKNMGKDLWRNPFPVVCKIYGQFFKNYSDIIKNRI